MNKLRAIAKNPAFLSLLGTGTTAVLGFVSVALLARKMDTVAFGDWMLFLSGYTFLEMLRSGLLHTALIRHLAGSEKPDRKRWTGAAWLIGLGISLALMTINLFMSLFLPVGELSAGFHNLIRWSGLALLLTFPFQLGQWLLQERMRFLPLLLIKLTVQASFILGLFILPAQGWHFSSVAMLYFVSQALGGMLFIISGESAISSLFLAGKEEIRKLIRFGRFSMGTTISANLLRSSDTLLIGAFLGPQAVAIYSLPQKLLEVLEIPLRAVMGTALPSMSKKVQNGDMEGMRKEFSYWTGLLTILILPVSVVYFLLADSLVLLLGGAGFESSAWVLRAFILFAFLLPFDRFSGVALDVLHQPQRNLYKVLIMLFVNLAGDIIILLTIKSVVSVALVSVLTFGSGAVMGFIFLRKYLPVSPADILKTGVRSLIEFRLKPDLKFSK